MLPTLALAASVGSCLEPTEVRLTITTDLPCALDGAGSYALQRTFVDVSGADGWDTVAQPSQCAARIGSLTIVPGADPSKGVTVQVRGEVTDGAKLHTVKATRRIQFVSHQPLPLTVNLSASCLDIECPDPATQTCENGVCVGNVVSADGGGLVTDASVSDVFIGKDVLVLDAPRTDAPVTVNDAGLDAASLCPPAYSGIVGGTWWHFDEGSGSTTIDSMMTVMSLGMGTSFATPGFCGKSALKISQAQTFPKSGTGKMLFGIGFYLSPGALFDSVPFLARSSGNASWALQLDPNGALILFVTAGGSTASYKSQGLVLPNAWNRLSVVVQQALVTFDVNSVVNAVPVSTQPVDPANVSTTISRALVIDELVLAN